MIPGAPALRMDILPSALLPGADGLRLRLPKQTGNWSLPVRCGPWANLCRNERGRL